MRGQFQPSGKCGNCHWFKRSIKKNDIVVEAAGCRKDIDPENCPLEEFMPRNKKKAKRRHKSWELDTRKTRKAEKRFRGKR